MSCSGLREALERRAEWEMLLKDWSRLRVEVECLRKVKEIKDWLKKYGKKGELKP